MFWVVTTWSGGWIEQPLLTFATQPVCLLPI
jgi:hypothetical protein